MIAKLLFKLENAMHRLIKKKHSKVASNVKVIIKFVGLEAT